VAMPSLTLKPKCCQFWVIAADARKGLVGMGVSSELAGE